MPETVPATEHMDYEARVSYQRLLPAVQVLLAGQPREVADSFLERWRRHWPRLFSLLLALYGKQFDFFWHLEQLVQDMARSWIERPPALRERDRLRELASDWYQSHKVVGGTFYVDLFSENLDKLKQQIPYFKDLGLTYLHLMPLFAVRPGMNDGGYAVSNYRSINPDIGTIDELVDLATALREAGIMLVLDFVFNHTADDHTWAKQAVAGDETCRRFYFLFEDRTLPDQYERQLREIFPTVRRGNFTWHEGMERWVWTTFNSFQWDLNYANPDVFRAMAGEMLFLANVGIDILRLDAVAFIWKRMGTDCENQPEAHTLIRAFNAVARICAPGLLFKSEAIVHPDEVVRYVDPEECQVSYNPLLMALLWEALATREVKLLRHSLQRRFALPAHCTWCNYLRCHDDIGWTFDDHDAEELGINPYEHRRFLNAFYTGQFDGAFARGVPFQHNPQTGDMRISGTLASLAGLEQASEENNPDCIDMAVRRILLLRAVMLSIGGIPLLYLGEEWGLLNDYSYVEDPAKAGDTRWIHRPHRDWEYLEELTDREGIGRRIYDATRAMVALRKELPALSGQDTAFFDVGNPHVFAYTRSHEGHRLVILANFSETPQCFPANTLRLHGVSRFFLERLIGEKIVTRDILTLEPYQVCWLERD